MARKLISILLTFVVSIGFLYAQEDNVEKINKIKKDSHYLYVTGTSTVSKEDASKNAEIMLAAEVERWLDKNVKEDIVGYIAKWEESISTIDTKIGKLFRSFAYVNKKNILPCYEDENVVAFLDKDDSTEKAIVAPIEEISIDQDIVADSLKEQCEPSINEPQTEVAPITETDSFSETDSLKEQCEPSINELQTEVAPTAETDLSGEIVPPDDDEVEKIDSEPSESVDLDNGIQAVPIYGGVTDADEEQAMLQLSTRSELRAYLHRLQKREKYLESYDVTEIPTQGTAYLFVLDYHGIIRKCIRVTDGAFCDVATNQEVNLDDVLNKYSTGTKFCFTIK